MFPPNFFPKVENKGIAVFPPKISSPQLWEEIVEQERRVESRAHRRRNSRLAHRTRDGRFFRERSVAERSAEGKEKMIRFIDGNCHGDFSRV